MSENTRQPNENLMIIEQIEGCMNVVNKLLGELKAFKGSNFIHIKAKAYEEIDLFQKTTLFELRKAFE